MSAPERYAFGEFTLERTQKRVLRGDGTSLPLTPRLFDALLLFVQSPGELIDKESLLRSLWPGLVVEENNLSQVVSGLQRALGDDAQGSRFIQTVPRRGFRFIAEVTALPATTVSAEPLNAAAASVEVPASVPTGTDAYEAPAALSPNLAGTPDGLSAPTSRRLAVAAGSAVLIGGAAWWFKPLWTRPADAPTASLTGPTASLAVLPFKPLLDGARDELLELGMADSLIARLSRVPGLAVRSIGAVRRYAGLDQDPLRAARELDVTWVIDGSLQRSGDRFRATARLLNASNGVAAWSGSFDEAFTGVFQIQDQISERVIQQLGPALSTTTAGARFAELGGTHNTDAYQLYLAAQWRSQGGLIADIDRSVAWLNQALAIDPKYALAWSLLAWTHRRRLWNADGVPGDVFAASDHALRQALALAPNLAQARAGVGFRKYWYDFDWDAGEREFRAALAADANEVSAHWGLAYMLLTQGRLDEGYLHLQLARELDPLSPVFSALEGSFLLSQGRLSEARTRLSRTVEIAPNAWLAVVALALLDIKDGQSQKGLDALRRAAQLTSSSRPQALLGKELSHLGRVNEARSILDSLLARSKTQFVPPTHIAIVHAALGETTAAMDALERAYVVRDTRLTQLKDDECWLPLRKEPRFMALRSKLGLDAFGPGLTSV